MRSTVHTTIAAAIAVLVLTAAAIPAQATENVEVQTESGGAHCPAVTITEHTPGGGCVLTAASVPGQHAVIAVHIHGTGEIPQMECEHTFSARAQETGHGFFYNQTLVNEAPENLCNIAPCDEVVSPGVHPNTPWPFHMHEFAGVLWLGFTFCLKPVTSAEGTDPSPCTIAIPIVEPTTHDYVIGALPTGTEAAMTNRSRCSEAAFVSLTGQWAVSGDVEIVH